MINKTIEKMLNKKLKKRLKKMLKKMKKKDLKKTLEKDANKINKDYDYLYAKNSNNQYIKNILKEKKWKLGHNICSLIIDWWNIPNYRISQVQCYYHRNEKGQYPLLNSKIDPAPIFNKNCKSKKCNNYGNNISKCQLSHNTFFSLAVKNLAQNY